MTWTLLRPHLLSLSHPPTLLRPPQLACCHSDTPGPPTLLPLLGLSSSKPLLGSSPIPLLSLPTHHKGATLSNVSLQDLPLAIPHALLDFASEHLSPSGKHPFCITCLATHPTQHSEFYEIKLLSHPVHGGALGAEHNGCRGGGAGPRS